MATWTVNINGGADFLNIQPAINAASPGDTILVAAGIYDEIVTINKSLTILGAQANVDPKIGGRPGGESIIQYSTSGSANRPVQIAANDIVFNGFEIANFFYGIQIPSTSFTAPVENISLEYNYIHSTVCFVGITSEGGTLRNFKVSHNIVHVASAVNAIAAINLTGSLAPHYENIEISSNEIENTYPARFGLFAGSLPSIYSIDNMVIKCNHFITPSTGTNFNIGNILNGQFYNNVVEFSEGLIGIDTGAIYGNSFINGGFLTLWGNEYGFTRPSRNVFISYNNFTDQVIGKAIGLRAGVLSDTIKVTLNAFLNAGIPPTVPPDADYTGYILVNLGTGTLDVANNWWGSPAGPAGNAGGTFGAVTTSPYLTSYTLTPSKQTPPACWPISAFMPTQPGFWIYPTVNQLLTSITAYGGIATVGNTLGLWGQFNPPNPAGGVFADGIGAFTTTNAGLTFDGYPAGTTATWQQNASSNTFTLPAGSSIVKAYLFYSATRANSVQDVSPYVTGPVVFTPPSGIPVSITPDAVTSIVAPTTGSTVYHAMKDVTALMAGSGNYGLGAVPGVLGVSNYTALENNFAGWTIVVIYTNPLMLMSNLSVWDEFEMLFTDSTVDIPIAGFSTYPAGTLGGKLWIAVGNGDNYVAGDQTQFGPNTGSLTVLSGPNNGAGNFYQSQINDDNGVLLTTGTFGTSNQPFGGSSAALTAPSARQGWDKTAVDVSSTLTYGQTSAIISLTDPELYFPQYAGLQIDVAAPIITPTKTVSSATANIGDILTYTITFANTGNVNADHIVITDPVPTGTSYVSGSITANVAITGDPTTTIQLTNSLVPGSPAVTISYKISIDSAPTPNPILNIATVHYDYIPEIGFPPVDVMIDTDPASTFVFGPLRGIRFL